MDMTRHFKQIVPALGQAAICVFLGLMATSANAGLVDEDMPRLSSGDGAWEWPVLTSQGMRPAGHNDSSIMALRRSMERLVDERAAATSSMQDQSAVDGRLQRALRRLSREGAPSSTRVGPRIAALVDSPPSEVDTIAGVESQLARIKGVAAKTMAARPVAGLKTLQLAMQRFERARGVVPSDTFARVYIGLDDKIPKLSNMAAKHPSVPTRDLRARVVDARTAAASSLVPDLVTAASGLRLGDVDLPASGSTELADLVGPLDQVALSDVSGQSDTGAPGPSLHDIEHAIDDVELEDLGVGLASAEAPVGVDQLQDTRAGFLLDNGIRVDFSVTRLTVIDGLDQQQAQDLATNMPLGLNPEALTQIAAGQGGNTRVLTTPADGTSAFTVVQNALDNQSILDVTTFNIDIQGAGLRSLDFIPQSFLPEALPPEVR